MIAHRLSTVQDVDEILVFDEGKIIERGTHAQLLAAGGQYAAMWKDYQTSVQRKVERRANNHEISSEKVRPQRTGREGPF